MKEKYHFIRGKIVNLTLIIYFSTHLHSLLANSIQKISPQGMSAVNEFNSLAICICEISKRELAWKPTTVLKIGENPTEAKAEFTEEIIEVLTKENMPCVLMGESDNVTLNVDNGNYLFVDYFDNNSLLDFDFDVMEKRIKYLWVLDNSEKFFDGDFQSIGNKVGKYDMTFLLRVTGTAYKIVTFIPEVDNITCKVVVKKYVHINTCVNGNLKNSVIYPAKNPTDFKRCPFKVGLGSLYPFAMIENKESLKTFDSLQNVTISGCDVEIIKIISENLNAALDLYYVYKLEENALIYTEYLTLVINGSLDACAGGMYRIFGDVVDYSGLYMMQAIGWIYTVHRPTLTWQNLITNIDGLYLFILFYLTYSIVWYVICTFDNQAVTLKDTVFYSWGALIGTTSLPEARSLKQKILNIVYLNMCLHLSVYISIQLYSYLTIRGPPEILKSNEDIMNSGRKPYLHTIAKYFTDDEKYIRFANTSAECSSFLDCCTKILNDKGITAIIEGNFVDIQAETVVNDEARMLRSAENLLVVFYEMPIRKNSPFVWKFQRVLTRLFEAGISLRLFEEAIGIIKVEKARRATQNIVSNSYSCQEGCAINFGQISGVFYLWMLGCGGSSIVFIIELLYKRGKIIERNGSEL